MLPQEVFLSHASADYPAACALAEIVRRHGIAVWYSRTNIVGAQQWHDEIGAALQRCDWFVIVLTASSVSSVWVKRELLYVLQKNRFENRIVPLLYESCEYERLSWVLPSFQSVDFRVSVESGTRELLRMWGVGYRP